VSLLEISVGGTHQKFGENLHELSIDNSLKFENKIDDFNSALDLYTLECADHIIRASL